MAPAHDLLALFGALDRSVVESGDPQWTQLVEAYLPGTTGPGRHGWYDQTLDLMRRFAPDSTGVENPTLNAALQNLSELVRAISPVLVATPRDSAYQNATGTLDDENDDWTLGGVGAPALTATQKAQLFYGAAVLGVLVPQAPAGSEFAALAVDLDVLDDFYGFVGDPPAADVAGITDDERVQILTTRTSRIATIKAWVTPGTFTGNTAWPQLITGILKDDQTAILPEIANVPVLFATGSMKILSATGDPGAQSDATAAVTVIDGITCAVLTTDASRTDVEIGAVKAIVDPLNWDQLSRFFTTMPKLPCNAQGASQVLEHVSTDPDAFNLITALKYWKEDFGQPNAAAGQPDPAGIVNYELSDDRAGTGDCGLVLVDSGYIHIGPNIHDGVRSPGVRVKTSKMVAIEGCSVTATAMFINMLGWAALGNSMLFDSAKRPANSYARKLQPWQVSPETTPVITTAGQDNSDPPDPTLPVTLPTGVFAGMFGEMAKLWAQAVAQTSTSAATLATKWSTNALTVQDLIDESTKLGGQLASGPWQYLAAAQQQLATPPTADDPNSTAANQGGS
jgi:hypothetical protein